MPRPQILSTVAREAGRHGLQVPGELHHALLLPSLRRCQQRVAGRTGHGFTDATATADMHADFTAGLYDLDERHVLVHPADEPARVATELLERLHAGQFRCR